MKKWIFIQVNCFHKKTNLIWTFCNMRRCESRTNESANWFIKMKHILFFNFIFTDHKKRIERKEEKKKNSWYFFGCGFTVGCEITNFCFFLLLIQRQTNFFFYSSRSVLMSTNVSGNNRFLKVLGSHFSPRSIAWFLENKQSIQQTEVSKFIDDNHR